MTFLPGILPYVELVISILLIIVIALQQRGASLGGAFGGDNFASTFYKRRGSEKFLFQIAVILSVAFIVVAILGFLF